MHWFHRLRRLQNSLQFRKLFQDFEEKKVMLNSVKCRAEDKQHYSTAFDDHLNTTEVHFELWGEPSVHWSTRQMNLQAGEDSHGMAIPGFKQWVKRDLTIRDKPLWSLGLI